jgi:hypothetical protein
MHKNWIRHFSKQVFNPPGVDTCPYQLFIRTSLHAAVYRETSLPRDMIRPYACFRHDGDGGLHRRRGPCPSAVSAPPSGFVRCHISEHTLVSETP